MITFWVVAVALLLAVVALLAVPLAKRASAAERGVDQNRSNVALFRDQLTELERDRAHGLLTDEQFEQARIELEQRLLADVHDDAPNDDAGRPRGGGTWRYAVLACVPVASLLGYLVLGTPEAMDPLALKSAQGTAAGHAANLDQLAERLAQRLEQNPEDTEAWVLLARSYQMLGRNAEAVKAFARAIQLVPGSAQLYADYADVQIAAADGQWTDAARAAVRKALEIDPAHPKGIWLAGTDAFMHKDYAQALKYWETLLPLVEPGSEVGKVIASNIDEAKRLAAGAAEASAATTASTRSAEAPAVETKRAQAAEAIRGTVSLDVALRDDVKPDDAVFVFARAAQGPRMPLAIRRVTVRDLPYAFSLDDGASMAPGMSISKFAEVIVGARVSKSGDATPKPGDLEGFSKPVKPGASGIEVRIDARVR